MTFADEVYGDGVAPVEEDVSPFAGSEDEHPESYMDAQEVL
jgi:hypothetical protein